MTSFENHKHTFKRTKPLKGNSPAIGGNGTIYCGSGAYAAVPKRNCQLDETLNIFDTMAVCNNFWVSYIEENVVTHVAYGPEGHIIDTSKQNMTYYTEI